MISIMVEPEIESYSPVCYNSIIDACKYVNGEIYFYRVRKKLKKKRHQYLRFPVFSEKTFKSMDLAIVFGPYATSHNAKALSIQYKIPLLHLEKGFIPKSVLCDIKGFWGEASIINDIDHILDQYCNEKCYTWSSNYSKYLIENNISKNRQPKDHSCVNGDFVFLPMQYMNDQSVLRYGNMPYPKFVKIVAQFCSDYKLILAIKKHPRAYLKETKVVNKLFKAMKKRYGNAFQVVDGSIHWFCQNCVFMAGMNTGAILDGIVNNCIMSHCGKSIYMNSGAVIHDDNTRDGLEKCLYISSKDKQLIIKRQKALLYYLYNHYLLLENDTHGSFLNNKDKVLHQIYSLSKKDINYEGIRP